MCFSPLTIRNPKCRKNAIFDRTVLEVPCGQCKQCIDRRRNDYFIRMYFEYLDCQLKGGYAYFLTLTYRNSDINRLPSGEFCYRHDDVKNYLKLIRSHFLRDYNIDVSGSLRYFCCSEFGEQRHRPHYHIVFYCSKDVPARVLQYLSRSLWSHGFTKPGKFNGGIVNDISAFSYVSKYCTKGDLDCKTCRRLLFAVDKYVASHPVDTSSLNSLRHNCRPIIRASKNFGLFLLGSTDYSQLERGVIQLPDKRYTVKDYPLPLYYDRKVFYDVVLNDDGNPVYRLNSAGYRMKLVRFDMYKKSFKAAYDLVFGTHFSSTIFDKVNNFFDTKFTSNSDMFSWLNKTYDYDWSNLFNYSLVYNGYSPLPRFSDDDLGIVTMPKDDFDTRLSSSVGLSVNDDFLQSLDVNTRSYSPDYALVLVIFRFLFSQCNLLRIEDFRNAEATRHRLTSLYYQSNIYSND